MGTDSLNLQAAGVAHSTPGIMNLNIRVTAKPLSVTTWSVECFALDLRSEIDAESASEAAIVLVSHYLRRETLRTYYKNNKYVSIQVFIEVHVDRKAMEHTYLDIEVDDLRNS